MPPRCADAPHAPTSPRPHVPTPPSPRPGHPLAVLDLLRPVRRAVLAEDVVEPDRRLVGVRLLPRIPGVDRVRLARDEAPAVRADLLLLEVPQHRVERAALGPGHELRAEQ